MAVLVTTESQMQKIRREVTFCYLCGSRLGQSVTNRDHVIPQALFDTAPISDPWYPILDVHKTCHDTVKNANSDEVAVLFHRLYTLEQSGRALDTVGWATNLRRLRLELSTKLDDKTGETLHLVKGFVPAYAAVWNWVRGMHAVLYRSYLPNRMRHFVHAPIGEVYVPPAALNPGDRRVEKSAWEFHADKSHIDTVISHAFTTRQADCLRCWGGRCVYVCTWLPHIKPAGCVWALLHDGVTEYSLGTPFPRSPWLGWYQCERPPPKRTEMTLPT